MSLRKEDLLELKGSPLLQGLSEGDLGHLAAACHEKELSEGTTVFIENMPGESLYLIRTGAVRITRMLGEGDEETLVILGPEEVFGEMAILDQAPRSATAKVVENARLVALRRSDFERLCEEQPRLAVKLMRNLIRIFSRHVRESSSEYREMLLVALGRK